MAHRSPLRADATAALRLDALPADVLITILRLIPVIPRMRTLATLSKRWNELTYRSVDALLRRSIDEVWHIRPRLVSVLSRLPSLTCLDLSSLEALPDIIRLPPTLCHLGVLWDSPLKLATPLPSSLTSLELRVAGSGNDVAPLLAELASYLCRLKLAIYGRVTASSQLGGFLKAAHFPVLTDLSIGWRSAMSVPLCALYRTHAPQLEALTLLDVPHADQLHIAQHRLPRLRTLSWEAKFTCEPPMPQAVEALLSHCPQLVALHTEFVPQRAHTALRSLSLDLASDLVSSAVQARDLPHLHSLSAGFIEARDMDALAAVHELITACDVSLADLADSDALHTLTRLTRLTDLELNVGEPCPALPSLSHLRNLRSLHFTGEPWAVLASLSRQILHDCPALTTITMVCLCEVDEEDFAQLLTELDQRGVALLQVQHKGQTLRPARQLHWLSVQTSTFA